jgi:cytochrome P450
VRITPDEVHLSDPENYDVIYHMGSKYSKSEPYYKAMGGGYSSFTTMSNEEHRIKRSRLSPFFSKKKVLELEDSVQKKAEKLCALLAKKFSFDESIDLHHGFRALSVDIITDYAFNQCYDLLDSPDLGKHFFHMIEGLGPMMWVFQQWPALQKIALSLPQSVASALSPPLKHLFNIQAVSTPCLCCAMFDICSTVGNKLLL